MPALGGQGDKRDVDQYSSRAGHTTCTSHTRPLTCFSLLQILKNENSYSY